MNILKPAVYVDADACPVKDEIIEICQEYQVDMVFVSSYAHQLTIPAPAKVVTVDSDKEAADLYVMNHIKVGDVCVTQDHALASILLPKRTVVLSPRGIEYDESKMEQMLDARFVSAKQRRMGKRTKGPKPFSKDDRERFKRNFEKIIAEKAGI